MEIKLRPWTATVPVVLCCAAIVAGLFYFRSHRRISGVELMTQVPAGPALVVYIDVGALRGAGLLGPARAIRNEEPEYRAFVTQTGFDFRTDLDTVIASFRSDDSSFYLAQGRFDWKLIRAYAIQAGGSCWDAFCTMPASTPGKHISFEPVRSNVLAIAVSPIRSAVKAMMALPKRTVKDGVPNQPIWVSIPQPALQRADVFPSGIQFFIQGLQNTENVTFSVGPKAGEFEASLDVACRSAQDAIQLLAQMETLTEKLRKAESEKSPGANSDDLGGVIARGRFRREDRFVFGKWPLQRGFIESLTGGAL